VTCRELIEFIVDYLDGQLPAGVHEPFEHHLSLCPACQRYLRQYRATASAGVAAFADPDADVPDDVPAQLITAILESRRRALP
jgi:anti-sigma factor RsiW